MAITSLIVANLSSTSTYVASFVVEVYTDSGLTNLYGSGSCGSIGNGSGGSIQASSIVIGGLTFGQTYYTRAGVVAPITSITTWSATSSIIAGSSTAPSGVTYTGTLTATTSGVTCSVTPASAPSDILKYEAIWNTDGSAPASTASPMWSGPTDGTGVLHFFAGSTPGNTVHVFVRAVNTAGLRQSWVSLGAGALVITPVSASDIQQEVYTYAADTGSANAYAVTLSPAPTIVAGSVVSFKAAHANTGASTLAINGGTATAITKNGTTALSAGDIATGQIITARYDGTEWQILTGGGGITQLTGDVTAGPGTGSQAATLVASGVVAGTYTNPTVTFDAKGRATFAMSGGAGSFVQGATASNSTNTTASCTLPSAVTAGNAVVVILYPGSGSLTVSSLTDSHGNTYNLVASYTGGSTSGFSGQYVYLALNVVGGADTVSVVFSQLNNQLAMLVAEYANIVGVSALDGTPQTASSGSATSITAGPLTTTTASDLLLSSWTSEVAGGSASATATGFTNRTGAKEGAGGGGIEVQLADMVASVSGSYSAAWTATGFNPAQVKSVVLLALKSTGTSSGGTGVTSINSATGSVTIAGGTGTSVSTSGGTVTVTAPVMVGDSGSGGTAGIVPAPASGTAAAGKFLKADGTWAVPASAAGSNATQIQGVNVSATAPTTNQVLQYDGTQYVPATVSGGGSSTGIAPTRRGSVWSGAITGTSATLALPSGSAVGDLCVLVGAGGNSWNPTTMTGWVRLLNSGGFWTDGVYYKTLTSTDISAGNVPVTIGGSFVNYVMMSVYAAGAFVASLGWSELSFNSTSMALPSNPALSPRVGKVDVNSNMDWMILVSARPVNTAQTVTLSGGTSTSVGSTTNGNGSGAAWNANFGNFLPVITCNNNAAASAGLGNIMLGILS